MKRELKKILHFIQNGILIGCVVYSVVAVELHFQTSSVHFSDKKTIFAFMNAKKIFQKKYMKYAKYVIVAILFVVWIGFFDVHNLKNQVKYRLKINDLKDEKSYFLDKIKEDSTRLHELNTNDENLEKFAREKYHMKKEGEEIFLIKKGEESEKNK